MVLLFCFHKTFFLLTSIALKVNAVFINYIVLLIYNIFHLFYLFLLCLNFCTCLFVSSLFFLCFFQNNLLFFLCHLLHDICDELFLAIPFYGTNNSSFYINKKIISSFFKQHQFRLIHNPNVIKFV